MTIDSVLTFLAIAVFSAALQSGTVEGTSKKSQASASNEYKASRLVLVTFTDHTINSLRVTAAPTTYRQRDDAYKSSTWSERITNALAQDYDLDKTAEWPMTEVGMYCVVYRISDKTTITATIELLSKDERVKIVQDMHAFKTGAILQTAGQ